MTLKRKLTQDEHSKLSDELKGLYIEKNGSYILDIDDTAFEELKNEKQRATEELERYKAQESERIAKAEERARKKAKEEYDQAKNNKDVEAIEKSWADKYAQLEQNLKDTTDTYNKYVRTSLIEQAVSNIATTISTSPKLLAPHIRSRLDVDLSSETPKLIVLDENGQRSALTLEELQKSFIDNTDFSAIIKATSANGGAKAGQFDEQKAGESGAEPRVRKLGDMTDAELAELYAKNATVQED